MDFPNDPSQNMDNELPNDDYSGGDEDNTPNLSFIYAADPPATQKKTPLVYKSSGELADTIVAFKVSKNTFREFVRMKVKPSSFNILATNVVLGTRVSPLQEWHCSYYTKRVNNNILVGDYDTRSVSAPLKFRNNYTGNGTATITDVANDVITDAYFLSYTTTENSWSLSNTSGTAFNVSGPPAANGSWTVAYGGVTVLITPGTVPFQNDFTWVFTSFKTTNSAGIKTNEINLEYQNPTTGY